MALGLNKLHRSRVAAACFQCRVESLILQKQEECGETHGEKQPERQRHGRRVAATGAQHFFGDAWSFGRNRAIREEAAQVRSELPRCGVAFLRVRCDGLQQNRLQHFGDVPVQATRPWWLRVIDGVK